MKQNVKNYKATSFIFWLISVYGIFLIVYCLILNNATTLTQLLCLFAIACFVYIDVILVQEYVKVNKRLSMIKGLEGKYKYFSTFMDEEILVIEVLIEEEEQLKKDLANIKVKSEKYDSDEKFAKYTIDVKA